MQSVILATYHMKPYNCHTTHVPVSYSSMQCVCITQYCFPKVLLLLSLLPLVLYMNIINWSSAIVSCNIIRWYWHSHIVFTGICILTLVWHTLHKLHCSSSTYTIQVHYDKSFFSVSWTSLTYFDLETILVTNSSVLVVTKQKVCRHVYMGEGQYLHTSSPCIYA